MKTDKQEPAKERSEFLVALRNGALLGLVILAIVIPWMRMNQQPQPPATPPVAQAPVAPATPPVAAAPAAPAAPAVPAFQPGPMADFGAEVPSQDVRHVANWAFYTKDNRGKAVVILDKKAAKVYTLNPDGSFKASTPALLGAAVGDDSAPGIGEKPLSLIKQEEKTTPAGRFVAEPGMNTKGEDIVWVDYDAAVSMHRVRPTVAAERRLQRLASETEKDNRISFGCVNLPVKFYEGVLSPTVKKTGAIIYVLPETRTVQETFNSWDVTDPVQVARHTGLQQVAAIRTVTDDHREARRNRDSAE